VLDVEYPSDGQGFVLNCLRRNVLHHHSKDRVSVLEEALTAFPALHGVVAAAARVEVDGNVQFSVFLERETKYCSTFVKIQIDVTTNSLFGIAAFLSR
jgi:hypothetical protein